MSGLDDLKIRLNYQGGNAEGRIKEGKLRTLKRALLYSYQAGTAILKDGREFRCLINSDRTKADYDCKIISIPYEDICLGRVIKQINENGEVEEVEIKQKPNGKTSKGIEKIGMKPGDIFKWKETNTCWLVYLEKLQEYSYFRAEIYKCEDKIEIDGEEYPIYIRGPVETTIQWNQKKGINWNDINYSLIIYITKDDKTLDYFHRFKKVKINKKTWEVKTVDSYSADGIIEVCLGEWFENKMEEYYEEPKPNENIHYEDSPYIDGPNLVQPFDICEYSINNLDGGKWKINNCKAKIIENYGSKIIVEIVSGKSGEFDLIYFNKEKNKEVILPIVIKSI